MSDLSLAAEFAAPSREAWLKLVSSVLKGGDFEGRLVSRTHDGIRIEPLYQKADGSQQSLRSSRGRWRIAQRVDHPDPDAANSLALADLEGGADALSLVFPDSLGARGFGLGARTADDLDRALRDVRLDLIQLRLDAGQAGFDAAALVAELAARRGHALADLDVNLGIDPIGALAASGNLPVGWNAQGSDMLSRFASRGFRGQVFLADGRPYHEAGAGEAQELAAVLATGVAYLRALEAVGHDLAAPRDALSFLLVADADEFLTIAKFRALRRLWARIEEACGLSVEPIRLHAETAWRMITRRDPWVNMLRATVAVFSAGLGGADTVTVLPFTAALGLPDAFARRMARNTQLILMEEASLGRVADPAAGAGGFEALTDALCEHAWRLFQDIEREGGIVASLRAGALQARIAIARRKRERAVATRADAITGTSEFPDLAEAPVRVLLPSPPQEQAKAEPSLPSIRLAEPYERLRDMSDAQLARTGARPKVFLANLGPPSAFLARATFAKTFFEAGGIEAVTNDGFATADAAAAAWAASGARLACLCSSDEVYATHAAQVAMALRQAGARHIYVAAHPDHLNQDSAAGAISHVFAACDAPAILSDAMANATA